MKPFTEISDDNLTRRMRAVASDLQEFDRQITFKTARALATSADDVERTINTLCDEMESVVTALQDRLEELGVQRNSSIFSALTFLMRQQLTECANVADGINHRMKAH